METTLKTINDPKIARIEWQKHEVTFPRLCPATGNPQPGSTVTIGYRPEGKLLEVYSIVEYIKSFVGSKSVRDIEHLAQVVAKDCKFALEVPVKVEAQYILDIGQTVTVCVWSS